MRRALIAAAWVIGVSACGSMQAPGIELVSEAARPAYRQMFASSAEERCYGARTFATLRPVEEPAIRRLVKLLTDHAPFEEYDPNGHAWTSTPADCAEPALTSIGEPAIAHVIPLARHVDPDVRRHAVLVLARSRDPRAVEPLLAAFRDRDVRVRRAAVVWTWSSDPRFFDAYARALEDRDGGVRFQASRVIGSFEDERLVDVLLQNLAGNDVEVRQYAAIHLGKHRDPRIGPALITVLRDPSGLVQAHAALALGELKDRAAVEPLLTLVHETPDTSPRFAFIEALGKIGDSRAYDALISCLQSDHFVTRMQAADALRRLGDPRAAEAIRPLLNDPQPAVRKSAQQAVGELEASANTP
jgi:HEAT repeat protein